jgi:hypothetical protein
MSTSISTSGHHVLRGAACILFAADLGAQPAVVDPATQNLPNPNRS